MLSINISKVHNYFWHSLSAISICIFVIIKIPFLDLPYFWDEAWVYAPAAIKLFETGPSLLPNALPDWLTRGHPLLFHFLGSVWLKIFGNSFISLHSYVLFLSVSLLTFIHFFMTRYFIAAAGFFTVILLIAQPPFLLQSGVFLPEIQLTFFILVSFYAFLENKRLLYVFSSTCLLLTKETGLVFIVSLIAWSLIEYLHSRNKPLRSIVVQLLFLSTPIVISSMYFILQKFMVGWFFFPEHISLFDLDLENFKWKLKVSYSFLFDSQGRKPLVLGLTVIVLLGIRQVQWYKRLFVAFCILALSKILFGKWPVDNLIFILILPLLLAVVFYWMFFEAYKKDEIQGKLFSIIFIFGFIYMIFISTHFHATRYLTCLLPLLCILLVGFSYYILKERETVFSLFITAAILISIYNAVYIDSKIFGENLNYRDAIYVQIDVVEYFEDNDLWEKNICTTFINIDALNNPYAGYLSQHNKKFNNLQDKISMSTDYIVLPSFEPGLDADEIRGNSSFELVKKLEHKTASAEIYKRIGQ